MKRRSRVRRVRRAVRRRTTFRCRSGRGTSCAQAPDALISFFLAFGSGGYRLDDADRVELCALRGECGVSGRGRVEDDEADLVAGEVDRLLEPDWDLLPCQLLRGRPRPPLSGCALSSLATGEIRLDEVAWHVLDATVAATARKGQNVLSLLAVASRQCRRRASSVRERTLRLPQMWLRCTASRRSSNKHAG